MRRTKKQTESGFKGYKGNDVKTFTKEQVANGDVWRISHWHRDGGWEEAREDFRDAFEVIESYGIYVVYIEIDGEDRRFFSRGAIEYGLENLD